MQPLKSRKTTHTKRPQLDDINVDDVDTSKQPAQMSAQVASNASPKKEAI